MQVNTSSPLQNLPKPVMYLSELITLGRSVQIRTMAEIERKQNLILTVTQLQRDTIRNLFLHNGWEFDENIYNNTCAESETDNETSHDRFVISQREGCEECPYCLCKPCITDESNRQMWWESENTEPNKNNNSFRKEKYKRFWTMLFHREVFLDERYKSKKLQALQQDPHKRKLTWHKRDILPKCVIDIVRTWFPNPEDMPYMGHMWE